MKDDIGNAILISCLTADVPADGSAGYASSCIAFVTDGTTLDNSLYLNIGSNTSCNFDAMTTS
jgi:hypothetical protein